MGEPAYCIFIDPIVDGRVPYYRDDRGRPVVYSTRVEAEREIADDIITRLREFIDGQREFDEAMTVEEYVLDVDVFADGSVVDEEGNHFAPQVR